MRLFEAALALAGASASLSCPPTPLRVLRGTPAGRAARAASIEITLDGPSGVARPNRLPPLHRLRVANGIAKTPSAAAARARIPSPLLRRTSIDTTCRSSRERMSLAPASPPRSSTMCASSSATTTRELAGTSHALGAFILDEEVSFTGLEAQAEAWRRKREKPTTTMRGPKRAS